MSASGSQPGKDEEELFHAALQLPADGREAFLAESCGDDAALGARLRALLLAHESPAALWQQGPVQPAGDAVGDAVTGEVASRRIGPYVLLRELGEGGMGTVWLAEQEQPVRRQVALKVVKAGLDSRSVIARFLAEQQALAMMDHSNIARVFDAGATASGQPYFVMEVVIGSPITVHCDQHGLGLRERLALFVDVCRAVQHAHQKGVIHRDLKPSNILVTTVDGRAVPKVIDFGVAKALGGSLTAQTFVTAPGLVIGTPEYMSPEQAEPNAGLPVDTRSDVYSLGVLLYELLTGSTPIERARLQQAGLLEVLRLVREEEPPAPSTRVATTATAAEIAARRRIEPHALAAQLRGELDWIVMKAIDKEPARRYDAVGAMAADLERHLADEPVAAGPPGAAYRLRKLARKHRRVLRAAIAVGATMVLGTAASVWQAVLATAARDEARSTADQLDLALRAEQLARAAAVEASTRTLAALRTLTDDVVERQMGRAVQLDDEDRAFLGRIAEHYEEIAAAQGDGVEAQHLRAEGHFRIALLRARLGDGEAAVAAWRRAIEGYGRLVELVPGAPEHLYVLSKARANLGAMLRGLGDWPQAEQELRQALAISSALAAALPGDAEHARLVATHRLNLAGVCMEVGRAEEAEAEYAAAVAELDALCARHEDVTRLHHELARCCNGYGELLRRRGKARQAEPELRRAIELHERVVAVAPMPEYRQELGRSQFNLGVLLTQLGQRTAALAVVRAALSLQQALATEYPTVPSYRVDLASSHGLLGSLLAEAGGTEIAEREHRAAMALRQRLVAEQPAEPERRRELAMSHNNLGGLLSDGGRIEEAEAEYRAALLLREELVARHPGVAGYVVERAGSRCNLANLELEQRQRPDLALPLYGDAIEDLGGVLQREPSDVAAREFLRNCHLGRALALRALEQTAAALRDLESAIELTADPERAQWFRMALVEWMLDVAPAEAMAALAKIRESVPAASPEIVWTDVLLHARGLARTAEAMDDAIAAQRERWAVHAVQLLEQLVAQGWFAAPVRQALLATEEVLEPLRGRADFAALQQAAARR